MIIVYEVIEGNNETKHVSGERTTRPLGIVLLLDLREGSEILYIKRTWGPRGSFVTFLLGASYWIQVYLYFFIFSFIFFSDPATDSTGEYGVMDHSHAVKILGEIPNSRALGPGACFVFR